MNTHVDNSSPVLWSAGVLNHAAGVLNHVCMGLEPSNGRARRCLRALGPQDHLHSRPPGIDENIIQYTTIHACIYIYIHIYIYICI